MEWWEIVMLAIAGAFLIMPLAVVDYLAIGTIFVTVEEDLRNKDSG